MNTEAMNPATLRNLSPSELERHLYMTQPYSPAHLAAIDAYETAMDVETLTADLSCATTSHKEEKELRMITERKLGMTEKDLNQANTENQAIAAELTRKGGRIIRLESLLSRHQISFHATSL